MKTLSCIRWSAQTILLTAAAALLGSTLTPPASAADPSFEGPLGLQLYSLRTQFELKGVDRTLDKVKEFGIKYAETAGTYGMEPAAFKAALDARGIKAVSGHFSYKQWRDDPETIATEAKALGLQYAGCAYAGHKKPLDEPQMREIIKVFNNAGAVMAKHGLTFFYHLHGFEFQPWKDGDTLADLLIRETDPDNVKFQMDVLWIVFPGHDPVELLQKYPDRWDLMHMKDLKKGVETGSLAGKTDVSNDVTLGTGQMDWPAILAASKEVGIKYYFIEDESPTSEAQIPESVKYLGEVKLKTD